MNGGRRLLEINDLRVARPGSPSPELERFSLTLNAGETVVLLGEADCGKGAVLRLLGGLCERGEALSGTIRFGAGETRQAAQNLQIPIRVAWLAAAASQPLNPHAGVAPQLARVIAHKLGCPPGAGREELRAALARLPGAPAIEVLDQPPAKRNMVATGWGLLATACAQTPDLVLCDHAFADLSPAAVRVLTAALLAEQTRLGFAILYAARGPQTIARIGGRALVLRRGRVVEEGTAEHLMSGQTHEYTQSFFRALPRLVTDKAPRPTARGEPLLQVQGLILRPGDKARSRSRDGISFELRRGASLALVGEEGSGRRGMMRAVLGLDRRPGRTLFDAVDLTMLSRSMATRLRRSIAFVSGADDALDPRMTLWDTVEEPLKAQLDLSREMIAGYRDSALKRVGLASQDGGRAVAMLAPFDKRRLQVARAIVAAPVLVVIDEPLHGLDAVAQTTMRDLLAAFRLAHQAAFLVITGDLSVAQALADEVMVFHDGRVVERGVMRDLLRVPKEPATHALIEAVTFPAFPRQDAPV